LEEKIIMAKTLNIIGSGKVGKTLARLLHTTGACEILDINSNDPAAAVQAAEFIGAGRPIDSLKDMRPADIWMLTVPDTVITQVSEQLASAMKKRGRTFDNAPIAFHCSGFTPASALAPLGALGFRLASVHPNLTFAESSAAVDHFSGTPCGLEGDNSALDTLGPVFEAIGGLCFPVLTEHKALYHSAAIFSNNFTVVLQAIASEAWAAAGVPSDIAAKIQASLLQATVPNVLRLGHKALTGPAARGDMKVVHAQGAAVFAWQPDAGVIYQEMSRLARRLAVHRSPFEELSDPGKATLAGG
jgi:predicted short-subunit dehydrogenase-like oxidoreductase (DUF2520 family)